MDNREFLNYSNFCPSCDRSSLDNAGNYTNNSWYCNECIHDNELKNKLCDQVIRSKLKVLIKNLEEYIENE